MKEKRRIIYKYRDWKDEYHKNILLKNQIYLASPKDLNDPFDCRINANFTLLTPKEEDSYINDWPSQVFQKLKKED